MTLLERLKEDLSGAMKREDKVRRSTLRLVLSAVNYAEIAKQKKLDEADIIDVLAKEAKQRRESIEAFKIGKRQDLVAQEQAELTILQEYLPKQMDRDELTKLARQAITESGAKGLTDKGKVMGKLMPLVKGKADGKDVNEVVISLLSQ
jgi:uncharacterized protein YqeY